MKIEEFIEKINEGKYGTIEVARFAFKTGNTDGSGNYSIVQFKLGEERVEFNNSSGAWAHKLTTPEETFLSIPPLDSQFEQRPGILRISHFAFGLLEASGRQRRAAGFSESPLDTLDQFQRIAQQSDLPRDFAHVLKVEQCDPRGPADVLRIERVRLFA